MDQERNNHSIEIWGGAEYSVVRVGNNVYDQLSCSGHEERSGDPDYFHELGIKTIRYPLLWEKYDGNEEKFFRFHDSRLEQLDKLGITPVAGLLHHGSGPFFTNLHDGSFPELLAEYAFKIAQRYPFIRLYTPVNEPLTTARFSGLYGIWYPHLKNDRAFARIFLNELKGIVLSMKAVRGINPLAGLIQTEDICIIHSTPELQYQANFENLRRWLTYDFLLGKVDHQHPMRKYFTDQGLYDEELDFFIENKTAPEVCGFNYYVTSERYLDHRKSLYPPCFHGGNFMHEYADVEVVRANVPDSISSHRLLKEAWDRYKLPIALTEVHLACTREEQQRWFYEAWKTAGKLREEGVDFRAITAWSFFGSYDWSSLLCEKRNDYESGVYDIRSGIPRPTALAGLIKKLNLGENPDNDLLSVPGWWRRGNRFIYKEESERFNAAHDNETDYSKIRPLLITGSAGSLGKAFTRVCEARGIVAHLSDRSEMDIASEESVRRTIERIRPWGIINAAGFTSIDDAEKEAYTCFRENTIGAVVLAEVCRSMNIRFVTFSADQVFNGKKKSPYSEDDSTNPLNLYGLSKKIAEEKVLRINPDSMIVRSGFFFNPWHAGDGLLKLLKSGMRSDRKYNLPSDIIISPAYLPAMVNTVLDLMIDGEAGIWHLSNQQEVSFYDFARMAFEIAGIDDSVITPVPSSKLFLAARRPVYSVLKSSSGIILPGLENTLNSFIDEFRKETLSVPDLSSFYTEVI
ncbi:MAG TPA: sugar nucleotide-binding protein [Bacteroidales bacterium]|nr:sugar nucleotide-binding protein [Bacteroidales bacterium]